MFLIHTPLLSSRSVFATMNLYQISHKALLNANEMKRFICSVIRAHLRDLHVKKQESSLNCTSLKPFQRDLILRYTE